MKTKIMQITLTFLVSGILWACASRDSRRDDIQTDIPETNWNALTYVRTDLVLDGGSVVQTYTMPDGKLYKLKFPPEAGGHQEIIWIDDQSKRYHVTGSHNKNLLKDFLIRLYVSNKDRDQLIAEDIMHALNLVLGLPTGPLWNFAQQKKPTAT